MKIIENKFNPLIPADVWDMPYQCEYCGSLFEFDDSDIDFGEYGQGYVVCPCCGRQNFLDEYVLTLTKNNLEFPKHFSHSSKEVAVEIDNKTIMGWIREGLDFFQDYKHENIFIAASGDTMVIIFKCDEDDEYRILVVKDYYETVISFAGAEYPDS